MSDPTPAPLNPEALKRAQEAHEAQQREWLRTGIAPKEPILAAAIRAYLGAMWRPIEECRDDGAYIVYWPMYELDDDGNLTDKPTGEGFAGVAHLQGGVWDEPDAMNAVGQYFGDDAEYGEPTRFMTIPLEIRK